MGSAVADLFLQAISRLLHLPVSLPAEHRRDKSRLKLEGFGLRRQLVKLAMLLEQPPLEPERLLAITLARPQRLPSY